MRAAPELAPRAIALKSQRIDMPQTLKTAPPGSRRIVKEALTLRAAADVVIARRRPGKTLPAPSARRCPRNAT